MSSQAMTSGTLTWPPGQELVACEGVDLGYGKRRILKDFNLVLAAGDNLAIVGPNGSGKTTLLKALLGILRPLRGQVRRAAGLRFGYVPQRQFVDEVYPFTVLDIALMGRYPLLGTFARPGQADREFTRQCLRHVDIADLAGHAYRELSGGQKQRVLIARALAGEPAVLVLDEPTNDMDLASEHAIMELVKHLREADGLTVVMVSHLLNVVANYADSLVILDNGTRITGSLSEVLSSENLSSLYGIPVEVGVCAGQRVVVTGGSHD
jgi:ABC-type cobalamin/Fe3+-siderophores transport system ATPase subunit